MNSVLESSVPIQFDSIVLLSFDCRLCELLAVQSIK